MDYAALFEQFEQRGALLLPEGGLDFGEIPWEAHAAFAGVELKHIVTSAQTDGRFSFHLVRIAPGKKIGSHAHKTQLETHEVIAGGGWCINNGVRLAYKPGTIAILPENSPHEVIANDDGLRLFAKFMPALL